MPIIVDVGEKTRCDFFERFHVYKSLPRKSRKEVYLYTPKVFQHVDSLSLIHAPPNLLIKDIENFATLLRREQVYVIITIDSYLDVSEQLAESLEIELNDMCIIPAIELLLKEMSAISPVSFFSLIHII
jgi:hypothetical protein